MSTRLTAAFHQAGPHRFLQALLVLLLGINVGRPLALLRGAAGAELVVVAQSWLALVVVGAKPVGTGGGTELAATVG